LNLGLDIRIPPEYIADEHQRLRAYKRIADAGDEESSQKVLGELRDRYGAPPEAVLNLLQFSSLKSLAEKLGIETVDRRAGFLNVKFHKESRVDPQRLMSLVSGTPGTQFSPAGVLRIPVEARSGAGELLNFLRDRLLELFPEPAAV
jgi:transcription-repair coupling factor (superfamily II helicase)